MTQSRPPSTNRDTSDRAGLVISVSRGLLVLLHISTPSGHKVHNNLPANITNGDVLFAQTVHHSSGLVGVCVVFKVVVYTGLALFGRPEKACITDRPFEDAHEQLKELINGPCKDTGTRMCPTNLRSLLVWAQGTVYFDNLVPLSGA